MQTNVAQIAALGALSLMYGAANAQTTQTPSHGKAIFDQKCSICHKADSTEKMVGPGLKGLYSRGVLADGTTKVSDTAVSERIINGKSTMPPFKDQLTPDQIRDLIEYLKTL